MSRYQIRELKDTVSPVIINPSHLRKLKLASRTPHKVIHYDQYKSQDIVLKQPYISEDNLQVVQCNVKRVYETYKALTSNSNVVSTLGVVLDPPGIVQERLTCSLQQRLNAKESFSEEVAASIIQDVVVGLAAFHNAGYVHGNISPGNILLQMENDDVQVAKVDDLSCEYVEINANLVNFSLTIKSVRVILQLILLEPFPILVVVIIIHLLH
ncbi:hypothetical protein GEMRC1_001151 [Eukaryota sp. GEM-RC1]